MNSHTPESSQSEAGEQALAFADKLKVLLPGIAPAETDELRAARQVVLDALTLHADDEEHMHSVWVEYHIACERLIDAIRETGTLPHNEVSLWTFVHKALLFREVGDLRRYFEELVLAEDFAHNSRLNTDLAPLEKELNLLSS